MRWAIYADESGDLGFNFDKIGASRSYVVSMILMPEDKGKETKDSISKRKKMIMKSRGGKLQWKRLSSTEKHDDQALAGFFISIQKDCPWLLPMSIIADKDEVTHGLKDSNCRLMPYMYGLGFKMLDPFLHKTAGYALLYPDRNSPGLLENFESYVCRVLPWLNSMKYGYSGEHRYSLGGWTTSYDPCEGLADMFSSVNRVIFENYLECGQPIKYSKTWNILRAWHYRKLENWDWRGLLYHPYAKRSSHGSFLGDQPINDSREYAAVKNV